MNDYCNGRVKDFLYMQKQYKINEDFARHHYHIVRYEDLAYDPRTEMQRLYRWFRKLVICLHRRNNRIKLVHLTLEGNI